MTEAHVLAGPLTALYARVPLGMRLGLEPMREASARAGHPERSFDVVHVAGTNGKGSTSAMVEAIARAAGTRTGLYTSPHLCRFAERIRIDGEPISDAALAAVLEEALAIGPELSFFETATLAAFLAFRSAGVELAVIEVGIGGRLDATNIVATPRCTAITRIAFDHQDRLGSTLEEIAREKAGIAKANVPLVLGALPAAARDAAVAIARQAGARLVDAAPLPAAVEVGLRGEHQRENAAVAWQIADELGIAPRTRASGIASARWPGRLEAITVPSGPLAGRWLLDGAHNPDGVVALLKSPEARDATALVFGALADKAWPQMVDELRAFAGVRFYVAPAGRAPADPVALAARTPGSPMPSLDDALAAARDAAGRDGIALVCGSLYLVGQARARLLGLPSDPPVAL